MKNSTTLSKYFNYFIGVILLFLFWIILSEIKNNDIIYPKIDKVFLSLFNLIIDKDFIISFFTSLLRVFIVLVISLVISLVITFLYVLKKDIIFIFKPLLVILKAAPLAIISLYLWISLGSEKAPYLITLLMVLPVTIEGFTAAINEIDEKYTNQLKTEDISMFKKYIKIYIPIIMPYIIMTLLQTFGMGFKVMIMGEYICQTKNSLGFIIYNLKFDITYDKLIAILLLTVFIVALIEIAIDIISKKLAYKENKE